MFQEKAIPRNLKRQMCRAGRRARRSYACLSRLSLPKEIGLPIARATRRFFHAYDGERHRRLQHWDLSCKTENIRRFSEHPYRTKLLFRAGRKSVATLVRNNPGERRLLQ